jgi:hypothetical protein
MRSSTEKPILDGKQLIIDAPLSSFDAKFDFATT